MNLHMVIYLLGWLLLCEGALMVLPLLVAFLDMDSGISAFMITIALCLLLGWLMVRRKPAKRMLYLREGFVVTALGWIVISVFGALPFLFTGAITDPISALFETVSGFTTTGASILTDVEVLPRSLLFWRSFTHWIGGMGVLVFLLTLLPLTGGSHINLMRAESPGPQVEKLVPKVQSTAKILYGIYILLTILEILLLLAGKMPLFDAVTTTFGTAGTGGFGIKNNSIAGYSTYLQNVVTVFMILFGVNFNFYFLLLLRRFRKAFSMEEVRAYLLIIAAAILIITLNIRDMYESPLHAFQQAAFQVGSIITTTGFSTTDFDLWPEVSKTILVLLMFIGACAGSTGGGIKVSRFTILFKSIRKELHHFIHPQRVEKIVVDGHTVTHEVLRSINVFLITYFVVFSVSVLLVGFDNHDLITNFTAVAATLNNIGPGLELVGPIRNFSLFSGGAKLVLIFDMLAGRLELFPLLLLFTKETWKRF
ncbi:TrkH family potassium uptake protein [Angelakisella massiliensis]|uniref:TrkH family potassium uptake protein n=1 Tax=Angelakisella massiliensis TaxID=1871018 RepID=UPI0024B076CB|nr:TrkH family potassium uptake protein [Angelakisella massiliensis]